jgi:general L-amino acid transport system permease protein
MATSTLTTARPPFYRDTRTIGILLQIFFAIAVIAIGWLLYTNMITELGAINNASGSPLSWRFLGQTAGFEISEGPAFRPQETYLRAYMVGIANTLRVSIAGVLFATLLGVLAGVARVSNNWLLSKVAQAYVDVIRSTPLLVQLLFWYFGVIAALPDIREAVEVPNVGFLSSRGLFVLWPYLSETGTPWLWWLLGGIVTGAGAAWLRRKQLERQGLPGSGFLLGVGIFFLVSIIGFFAVSSTVGLPDGVAYELRRGDRGTVYVDSNGNQTYEAGVDRTLAYVPITLLDETGNVIAQETTDGNGDFRFFDLPQPGASLTWSAPPPIVFSEPQRQGFNFRGGLSLTPEFVALLLGLTIYTGAFIAEIVRAGINAVPKGQWEASRAVGLSTPDTLRMIVLPQALRVIIPPLTSQYLNLVKNSSLAIAIGYPDLFYVGRIIVNQSGAEVQMIVIVMGTYLSISLLVSAFMNWYNKRVAIVER